MSRNALGSVVVLVGLAIGAAIGMGDRPVAGSAAGSGPSEVVVEMLDVHVAGMVVSPGVVQVPAGSIVADAIAAAGGLRLGARAESVNLAAPLRSGDQVLVPGDNDAAMGVDDGLVALNRASAEELDLLPGVGPVLAGRIVAFRDQHGPFESVEDLLEVPGIGEAKLESIRDLVRVP